MTNSAKNECTKQFLTPQDILKIPYTHAKYKLFYGEKKRHYGELRLPEANGPHPIMIVIHGGCWMSKIANIEYMSSFAENFTKQGIATWSIEYNCSDNENGGYPGTFLDVGKAIDFLNIIAPQYNLNLDKVIVIGHSSGGHLALWAGARHKLNKNSDLYQPDPLELYAAINIAGPGDLRLFQNLEEKSCMMKVVAPLLGNNEERFAQCSPYELLPINIKQILVTGEHDQAAPIESMQQYMNKAKMLGDDVELIILKDSAHFEVVDYRTQAWNEIKNIVINLFKAELKLCL